MIIYRAVLIIAALAGLLVGSLIASVVMSTRAPAHDWYPVECCHALDCAPVTASTWVAGARYDATGQPVANPLPVLQVTTIHGTATVPPNMPRRPSQDNRMHACMHACGMGQTCMICIFVPPVN